MLSITFITPLFLIGALAAAIPLALHLVSGLRARQELFPTLRFLKISMDKTARRRRIRDILLLLLRMAIVCLLALALAEPLAHTVGGWGSQRNYAAVIILDNSMSMAARDGQDNSFTRARRESRKLLASPDRPSTAAVIITNDGVNPDEMISSLERVRNRIAIATIKPTRAPIAEKVAKALQMLHDQPIPQKAIYLFSDMQKESFDDLIALDTPAPHKDAHLLVVNTAPQDAGNVAITDLKIEGPAVVNAPLEFTATIINSSRFDRVATVGLYLQSDGDKSFSPTGPTKQVHLQAATDRASTAKVRFYYAFPRAGTIVGEVAIDADRPEPTDSLSPDDRRRFCLTVDNRIKALIVSGPREYKQMANRTAMLEVALNPYSDKSQPWPITSTVVSAERIKPSDLNGVRIAFFSNVRRFTDARADAIEKFVRGGGTAVFFLGPDVDADNYNNMFIDKIKFDGGLLAGRIGNPIGQTGPRAQGVKLARVAVDHRYFAGLFENREDYLSVVAQRYFRLKLLPRPATVLMELENGDPLLIQRRFSRGQVILCATSAEAQWSNLPITGLFLPMVVRMSLLGPRSAGANEAYVAGAAVKIRLPVKGKLPPQAVIKVTLPPDTAEELVKPVMTSGGYVGTFTNTARLGVYRWKLTSPTHSGGSGSSGVFVVNAQGAESDLCAVPDEEFKTALQQQQNGFEKVYIAKSVRAVNSAAMLDAKGRNWWDIVLAAVIIILVVEALVSNVGKKSKRVDV